MAINPKMLLESAMRGGGAGAAPPDSMPIPGAAGGAAGTAAGPQGGLQDVLPGGMAGEKPVGTEGTGVMSTTGLQNQMGIGGNPADATGQATLGMIQQIQNPSTNPAEKEMLNAQLQLAALRALTAGPSGAAGTPR